MVVCRDVDIDKAVADTHFALFFNHGELRLLHLSNGSSSKHRLWPTHTVRSSSTTVRLFIQDGCSTFYMFCL
jgi:hypothetical protein